MGIPFGLGSAVVGEQNRLDYLHERDKKDKEDSARLGLLETQNETAQEDAREQPVRFKSQQDLTAVQTEGAKEDLAHKKAMDPYEQATAQHNATLSHLQLNDAEGSALQKGAYASAQLMNNMVASGGAIDTSGAENMYNQYAPDKYKIKPGSMRITRDATNPLNTQISYVKAGTDKPVTVTLGNWNRLAVALMPPHKLMAVGNDQHLVDSVSGTDVGDHPPEGGLGGGTGKTSPDSYNSQLNSQLTVSLGGKLDGFGNISLDGSKTDQYNRISAVAQRLAKESNYSIPPAQIANAVFQASQSVRKQGADENSANFMPMVQKLLQSPPPGGISPQPAQPAPPQASAPAQPSTAYGGVFKPSPGSPIIAPPEAEAALKQHPELSTDFQAKYGYLPSNAMQQDDAGDDSEDGGGGGQ